MTHAYCNWLRCLIYYLYVNTPMSKHEIFVFISQFPKVEYPIKEDYLNRLIDRLVEDPLFREHYLQGPAKPSGRPYCLSIPENAILLAIARQETCLTLVGLLHEFETTMYGLADGLEDIARKEPCVATMFYILQRVGITLKAPMRRHVNFRPADALAYLRRIQHRNPQFMVAIDACAHSKESYLKRKGRSEVGRPCILPQFKIGTDTFSVFASCSINGLTSFQIFDRPIDSDDFCAYLRTHVAPTIEQGITTLILDNAAIHHTDEAHAALEEIVLGFFYYLSTYSPFFNPIENVFNLSKIHVRNHEKEALLNPRQFLTDTFNMFMVGGPRAGSIRGCWNSYIRLHDNYLRQEEHEG